MKEVLNEHLSFTILKEFLNFSWLRHKHVGGEQTFFKG